jgi:predicted nucleic acid-binding protein
VSVFFADTSALAKRYVQETGSDWTLSWILPSAENVVIIAELAIVEMASLLARHIRDGSLSESNVNTLQANFLLHVNREYLVIPQTNDVIDRARQLVIQHPLRTLDAVQLASTSIAKNLLDMPITFVSGDSRLLAAATAEGFLTDDPHLHP